jgi:hypothetical protein
MQTWLMINTRQDIRSRVRDSNRGRSTAKSNCSLDLEGLRKHSRQVGGRINAGCVIDCSLCDSLACVTVVETRWRIDLTADPLADHISSQRAPQLRHLPHSPHGRVSKLKNLLTQSNRKVSPWSRTGAPPPVFGLKSSRKGVVSQEIINRI